MAYPSVNEIKTYLKGGTVSTMGDADNGLLTTLLEAAIAFIEAPEGAGRTFEVPLDTTRTFDACRDVDGRTLYLDQDLCQITSVTNGDGQIIPGSAYTTEPRNAAPSFAIKLKASMGYAWTFMDDPEDAISITGRWGYCAEAPANVAHACKRLVAWLYRQKDSSAGEIDRPLLTSSGITILPSAVPADVMAVLKSYRKRGI